MNTPNLKNQSPTNANTSNTLILGNGWQVGKLGYFKTSGQVKERTGFQLYIRRRNLKNFITNFSQKSSSSIPENPVISKARAMGSSLAMGSPKSAMTPSESITNATSQTLLNELPVLSSFHNYPSLRAIRKKDPCLLIGYDSEWEETPYGRDILSWQFSLIDGLDLVEFVFLKDGKKNLSLADALGCILDNLESYKSTETRKIRKYKYCSDWLDDKPIEHTTVKIEDAVNNCKYVYRQDIGFTRELIAEMPDRNSKQSERDWLYFCSYNDFSDMQRFKINLVCHAGIGDLTALEYGKKNLLPYLTNVQGGLITFNPVSYEIPSFKKANNTSLYPISLSISDTMCHAPADKKKLSDLGKVLGIEKVEICDDVKSHMQQFLSDNPVKFMEYASTDSMITMLYASALYGYNNTLPPTITSATARVMKGTMMKYLNCSSDAEFDLKYRGLEKVKHGFSKNPDKAGFLENKSLEPISDDVNTVQHYASQAYHGGYNICSEVGYFPFDTFDYDLMNAYPTAMVLIPDIDWDNPIKQEIISRELTLEDFKDGDDINPISPFIGYIDFEFPRNCKYPCIPVNVEGVPVYPLSSKGLNGVYVAGPNIWLALRLGAKINCKRGYFLNKRYPEGSLQESRALASSVKALVRDRNLAKIVDGKDSLEQHILKTMVNSGYGKISQNVIDKSTWSAFHDSMESLGCSSITNPVSAMMITSIIQVVLIAAQNQIQELGYGSYSVTTDGFITNCPEHILKELDLYGMQKILKAARIFLTEGDPELWEVKHRQNDLLNITTRGNVSLLDGGVCAHNSLKSGETSDSYKDRLWLMTKTLSRTSAVSYTENEWSTFKDVVHGKPFLVKPATKNIRMDFDMKRKPIKDSFGTDIVLVENTEYEMAHFDTIPFESVDEFLLYRSKKKLTSVLRTESDWSVFWSKLKLNGCAAQPRDIDFSILNSCVMGYRSGLWDIPGLNNKTVDEKCLWLNTHNTSSKKFKTSDWKNARRPERQVNMLPLNIIQDKLLELQNASA